MSKPRYRLAVDAALATGAAVTLRDNAAHYLSTVLRLGVGEMVAVFNRADGEWLARITDMRKKEMTLSVESCLRAPSPGGMKLTVCFAPIKGGRMETIIEKATELGASVLQPVITSRTIVDKVNIARAEALTREAAEQCDRIDWPEIREPVKLLKLLGDWPAYVPLIYGDESGGSGSIIEALTKQSRLPRVAFHGEPLAAGVRDIKDGPRHEAGVNSGGKEPPSMNTKQWAVLAGPEGGFTPDEFAALGRVKAALGVGLGPRILRADTAVITLCAATLMAWGDWDERPRFVAGEN